MVIGSEPGLKLRQGLVSVSVLLVLVSASKLGSGDDVWQGVRLNLEEECWETGSEWLPQKMAPSPW